MALSQDLIYQFSKLANNNDKQKTESTVNGEYKVINNEEFVRIDGSDIWTPVSSTVTAETGDRVTVLIKNHSATVTGNITSPSARTKDVNNLKDTVDENGNTIKQLDNSIKQQGNSIIQINNNIKQQENTINQFKNTIDQQNNTIQQFDNTIKQYGDNITSMNNTITSQGNQITQMNDTITSQGNTINQQGNIIQQQGNTINQQGNTIQQQGTKLETFDADIKILNSAFEIKDGVLTGLAKIVIDNLTTGTLDAKYANIDFSNIGEAAIKKLFADSGIIKDLIMSDGKVTGELVGVTIKGDLIEGNTIKADKLVIRGEDGLYYKLNVNALGETVASSDEKYQNGLDGSVIVANSIVAEKIAVDDLVAFKATIGGFHIGDHAIYSGVKESIDNTTQGIYLGDDGQIAVGDDSNYIKYYDDNGKRKLEIKASAIKFGTGDRALEETIDNLEDKVNNVNEPEVGTRNLYLGTKDFTGDQWINLEHWLLSENSYNDLTVYKRTGTWQGLGQEVSVKKGEKYVFSFYVRGDENAYVYVYTVDSQADEILNPYLVELGAVTEEFVRYSVKFTATASGTVRPRVENSEDDSWIEICGLKFERGTVATDWSQAPEDIDSNLNNVKTSVLESTSTMVQDTKGFVFKTLENYVTNDGFNEYKQEVSTQYEQTSKYFDFKFNSSSEEMKKINNETNQQFAEFQKYIRFIDGNIILGKQGNEIILKLENDILGFLQNNERVTYLSNNKLYVTNGEFLESLTLGQFGFKPKKNGSLSFGKIRKQTLNNIVGSAIVGTATVSNDQ